MKGFWGRRFSVAALILLVLMITACGSGERGDEDSASDPLPDPPPSANLVFLPEYTALELESDEELYQAKISGTSLYYVSRQYGDGPEDSMRSICEYSMTEKQVVRRIPIGEGAGQIYDFRVLEDGRIYVIDYAAGQDGESGNMELWLLAFDARGEKQLAVNLFQTANIRIATIAPAVDALGRIYLPHDDTIVLFEADGTLAGEIPIREHIIEDIGMDQDGRIYVSSFPSGSGGSSQYQLAEVKFEEKALGESFDNYPANGQGKLIPAPEGGFLINTGDIVYRYDPDTESGEQLFSWMDCDISGYSIMALGSMGDGSIWALFQGGGAAGPELVCLTERDASTLPEKTELVIGTLAAYQELEEAVASFNRHNPDCHVTLREYSGQYAWTLEEGYSDAITALNMDIISARDCPDILDLNYLNVDALARNEVLEDLQPWLESSSVLKREDYVENILDSYTYDGRLLSIPLSVSLDTLAGRAARVGSEPGWTLEEMMKCAAANSDVELLAGIYRQEVLRIGLMLGKFSFIDWENAECRFDTEAFQKLLLFAAGYPNDPSQTAGSVPENVQSDKVLLSWLPLNAVQDIQLYEAMYGGEMTFIGFPTAEGEGSGCRFSTTNAYAITAKSENKETAWRFLEFCLNRDVETGFPTNREKLLEKAAAEEYVRDENGWLFLGLDGRPIRRYDSVDYNGWYYQYHAVTEEETAVLLYLMETAQVSKTMDNMLWRIIVEEATPFFQGQKTVEDAAAAIQSRAELYLKENQ